MLVAVSARSPVRIQILMLARRSVDTALGTPTWSRSSIPETPMKCKFDSMSLAAASMKELLSGPKWFCALVHLSCQCVNSLSEMSRDAKQSVLRPSKANCSTASRAFSSKSVQSGAKAESAPLQTMKMRSVSSCRTMRDIRLRSLVNSMRAKRVKVDVPFRSLSCMESEDWATRVQLSFLAAARRANSSGEEACSVPFRLSMRTVWHKAMA